MKDLRKYLNWNTPMIEARQRDIKQELDEVLEKGDLKKRSKEILRRLGGLGDGVEPETILDRYILAMSGLKMEINNRIYNAKTVRQLIDHVETVLTMLGDNFRYSNISFVKADYHRMLSQLQSRQGELTASRWNLRIAETFTGSAEGDVHRKLADLQGHGIRLAREGRLVEAADHFRQVFLHPQIGNIQRQHVGTLLLQVLRMTDEGIEFENVHDLIIAEADPIYANAANWEASIRELVARDEPHVLYKRYLKTNLATSYMIDAVFRLYCAGRTRYHDTIPPLFNRRERGDFQHRQMGAAFEVAETLQRIYDQDVNINIRIHEFGEALSKMPELPTFEHEVLLLQAGVLWARRKRLVEYEDLLMDEYRAKTSHLPALSQTLQEANESEDDIQKAG